MNRPGLTYERLVALFAAGALALTPPFLSIFNVPRMVAGIPALYVYLFGSWGTLIALIALVVSAGGEEAPPAGRNPRNPDPGSE